MGFAEAVRTCLNKYVDFNGRARRSEYWWWVLFTVLVSLVAGIVDLALGTRLVQYVASLALFLPGLAVAIRRLHDTDRSGWFVLLALLPIIGGIILIVFFLQDSKPANTYGPSPKALGVGVPQAPAGYQAPPA